MTTCRSDTGPPPRRHRGVSDPPLLLPIAAATMWEIRPSTLRNNPGNRPRIYMGYNTHDSFRDSLHCVVGAPLRPVAIRPRLKISLEDRLHYQLERSLHHPVPDRRNPQHADLAPVLRYLLSPVPQRQVLARHQFLTYLPDESFHSTGLDGFERHPINPRAPIVPLGQRICFA